MTVGSLVNQPLLVRKKIFSVFAFMYGMIMIHDVRVYEMENVWNSNCHNVHSTSSSSISARFAHIKMKCSRFVSKSTFLFFRTKRSATRLSQLWKKNHAMGNVARPMNIAVPEAFVWMLMVVSKAFYFCIINNLMCNFAAVDSFAHCLRK